MQALHLQCPIFVYYVRAPEQLRSHAWSGRGGPESTQIFACAVKSDPCVVPELEDSWKLVPQRLIQDHQSDSIPSPTFHA
ncbi:hypothetical protein GN958_ATG17232 [Phytophthora infestans]|uniref:Uncharacterized protein n=1 Tax=Phytophthora infestans TaxID=4787 RepID=A0A8S9TYP9_PHYIN|nr:hypothetical protein GN958_ATG17232 [Phytophthora infestans]